MLTLQLVTLSPLTRRGYLVRSGDPIGTDERREVVEDDDVVIDDVLETERGWLVRYHPVHVRPR